MLACTTATTNTTTSVRTEVPDSPLNSSVSIYFKLLAAVFFSLSLAASSVAATVVPSLIMIDISNYPSIYYCHANTQLKDSLNDDLGKQREKQLSVRQVNQKLTYFHGKDKKKKRENQSDSCEVRQ